jgi:hypothetical protein
MADSMLRRRSIAQKGGGFRHIKLRSFQHLEKMSPSLAEGTWLRKTLFQTKGLV